ncbi:hypothetical protein JCM9279_006909 [Rhodotorula babjevae]
MKRALSTAGSPPPASAPKPKKPRAARPRKPTKKAQAAAAAAAAAAGGDAGSPGASGADSPFPVGASSPPAGPASAVGSPARGRSASVAVEGAGSGRGRAGTAEEGGAPAGEGAPAQGEGAEDEDAEDEVFEFSDDEFGSNQREAAKQKEDVRVLLDHFDEAQNDRYDTYRRSGLNKGSVKKVVNQVLGQSVSQSIVTVVRGVAKVFVGELVEKARAVNPHAGSLTPQDLREAYRLYLEEHEGAGMGGATRRKKLFVR